MQPLHFIDKTQKGPVRAQGHTASWQQHWAKSDADLFLVSLLGMPRRYLGHRDFGTPISLREAGQCQGRAGVERECPQCGPARPTLSGHCGGEYTREKSEE